MQTGVIYARYSCDKQTENSILGQVRDCQAFAERNNINVIGLYKDEAISGKTAIKRPSFMKMIGDAALGMFDCIIVWKGDRFARSRVDAAKYKSELKRMGVRVLSATEANVEGAEAVLMDGINEAFAEYYIVELAEKVCRGMTQNAIDGRFNGGTINFGYKLDENRKIVRDEEKAFIVEELFDRYTTTDISINALAKSFKQKGYLNNRGKPFNEGTLRGMLKCEKYYGKYWFQNTVNMHVFPPIITKEVYDAAQKKMAANQLHRGDYLAQKPFYLKNVLYCGYCGEKMSVYTGRSPSNKLDYYYYKCNNGKNHMYDPLAFNKDELEDMVFQETSNFFYDRKMWDRIIDAMAKKIISSQETAEPKRIALRQTNERLEKIMDAIEKGADVDLFIDRIKELKEIKQKQEYELKTVCPLNEEILKQVLCLFFEKISIMDLMQPEMKKEIVKLFIDKIYVTNTSLKILFKQSNKTGESSLVMDLVKNTSGLAHQYLFLVVVVQS